MNVFNCFCEFAITIQSIVKDGWTISFTPGERRLGVSPCMKIEKEEEKHYFYSEGEVESWWGEKVFERCNSQWLND